MVIDDYEMSNDNDKRYLVLLVSDLKMRMVISLLVTMNSNGSWDASVLFQFC